MINKLNIRKDINKITKNVLSITNEVLYKAKIDTEVNKQRFPVEIGNEGVTVSVPIHFLFVDKGRKPNGNPPPIKDIVKWINEKKISIPKGMTVESFAFAVSNSIAKKGIKAKPFIETLGEEIQVLVGDYVSKTIDDAIKNTAK